MRVNSPFKITGLNCWLNSVFPQKTCILAFLLIVAYVPYLSAQEPLTSVLTAKRYIHSIQDTLRPIAERQWNGDDEYLLQGMDQVWQKTANGLYFRYIQNHVNRFLEQYGDVNTGYNKDLAHEGLFYGRSMLTLYQVTGQVKYFDAASLVWKQMQELPKLGTADVGVSIPFGAAYAALTGNSSAFGAISKQVLLLSKQVAQRSSGLEYEKSLGKYGYAVVELLDYCPESVNRKALLQFLNQCTDKMENIVSGKSGSWSKLAPETRSRFLYTLCKAARLGYLARRNTDLISKGYAILKDNNPFLKTDNSGTTESPGKGLWLIAVNEFELYKLPKSATRYTVLLDSYFNNETKTDQSGNLVRWHYKWKEHGDNGFSMWAGQFNRAGFETATLYTRPTKRKLDKAKVYIIVDPDTEKENKHPVYVSEEDVQEISSWVKSGGVLILMANDSANTELDNFNKLAGKFGVQFNKDSKGKVLANRYDMGKITIDSSNSVFKTAKQIFIKEFSSLNLSESAEAILKDKDGNIVVGLSKFGKGKVLLIGDPWLYNEYVDGRKLPVEYDNFSAAADLVAWICKQLAGSIGK